MCHGVTRQQAHRIQIILPSIGSAFPHPFWEPMIACSRYV